MYICVYLFVNALRLFVADSTYMMNKDDYNW